MGLMTLTSTMKTTAATMIAARAALGMKKKSCVNKINEMMTKVPVTQTSE
jgi:hypothetical protein